MKRNKTFSVLCLILLFNVNLYAYLQQEQTPLVKYLKPVEVTESQSGMDLVDCVYVINLDERPERWDRMHEFLSERGIFANRFSAINGWAMSENAVKELFGPYPQRIKGGAIGCLLSHLSVYKDAFDRGYKVIWVLEDDTVLMGDVHTIPQYIKALSNIDPDWHVLYTDLGCKNKFAKVAIPKDNDGRPDQKLLPLEFYQSREDVGSGMMRIGNRYGTCSMLISRSGLARILNYFSHVYLWAPIDIDIHYIPRINQYGTLEEITVHAPINNVSDTRGSSTLNPNRPQ